MGQAFNHSNRDDVVSCRNVNMSNPHAAALVSPSSCFSGEWSSMKKMAATSLQHPQVNHVYRMSHEMLPLRSRHQTARAISGDLRVAPAAEPERVLPNSEAHKHTKVTKS